VFGWERRLVPLIYKPEIPEKGRSYCFDISKAKRDFGWQPSYSYADVLRDFDREVQSGRFKA
jgi:UDP-glucose 4-epimerase